MARDSSSDPAVLPPCPPSTSRHCFPTIEDEWLPESRESEEEEGQSQDLIKSKPYRKWRTVQELVGREAGYGARWHCPVRFQHQFYGSLHAVERMDLMHKSVLQEDGVSSLHFSQTGKLLVISTTITTVVKLWDWAANKCSVSWESGHSEELIQAKFLPIIGDLVVVTSGLDGQVRVSAVGEDGQCRDTRMMAKHKRRMCLFGDNLAVHPDTPFTILSAGEDSLVYCCDIRSSRPTKVLTARDALNKLELVYIDRNPVSSHEFLVAGPNKYIRMYDIRTASNGIPLKKFCPCNRLMTDDFSVFVSGAKFNYNGKEVVSSYDDDDCIYHFDIQKPFYNVHRYEGSLKCNSANFFGPCSEFIISGSTCGNIFFWDKNTRDIVQCINANDSARCFDMHPQIPIIASGGRPATDIKIWAPFYEQEPSSTDIETVVLSNKYERFHERRVREDAFYVSYVKRLRQQIPGFELGQNTSPLESLTSSSDSDPSDPINFFTDSDDDEEDSPPPY